MTPLEIIALVFVVGVLLKIVMIFAHPKGWMSMAQKLAKNRAVLTLVYAVLAIVVGYFVIPALGIVNTLAAMLLGILVIGLSLVPHVEVIAKKHKYHGAREMLEHYWLALIVWLGLSGWALYALFLA